MTFFNDLNILLYSLLSFNVCVVFSFQNINKVMLIMLLTEAVLPWQEEQLLGRYHMPPAPPSRNKSPVDAVTSWPQGCVCVTSLLSVLRGWVESRDTVFLPVWQIWRTIYTEVFLMISYRSFAMVTSSVMGGSGDALDLGGARRARRAQLAKVWEPLP